MVGVVVVVVVVVVIVVVVVVVVAAAAVVLVDRSGIAVVRCCLGGRNRRKPYVFSHKGGSGRR